MTEEEKAKEIVRRLCEQGWDAYIVGGAARDLLSGQAPIDYDVVTKAPYEVIQAIFRDRKVALVGVGFKVCIVDGIDVATFRKDVCFDLSDKDCQVKTAMSIHEDLARRDLTINAIAFCPYTGAVVDDFGGLEDLKNRIIRFTGDPGQRILEDPCRIIRACRFLAKLEGAFDPATFEALKAYGHLVKKQVAPERIRLEILKTMRYRRPSLFFDSLHEIGLLALIFPSMEQCYGHEGGKHHIETIDDHLRSVGDSISPNRPLLRLTGYLHDCGKPAAACLDDDNQTVFTKHEKTGAETVELELKKLRFSLKEIAYIKAHILYHMRSFESIATPKAVRKLLRDLQNADISWKHWLLLKMADQKGNQKKAPYSRDRIRTVVLDIRNELKPQKGAAALCIADLAVNGKDIVKAFDLEPGPQVGRILNFLIEQVIERPELNTRERLLSLAANLPPDPENAR